MPRKPVSFAQLMASKRGEPSRTTSDRDYRARRRDASVDAVQAQAEKIRCSWRWRQFRTYALQREPLCRECKKHGVTTVAIDLDHIVPLVDLVASGRSEDAYRLEAVQPLCRACHNAKTAAERAEQGKRARACENARRAALREVAEEESK